MTARMQSRTRQALAAAATVCLGLVAVAAAPAAQAAEIDPNEPGSIVIHKYTYPNDGSMNPDGTGAQPTSDALAGVVFEYCLIDGIDLFDGSNVGWDEVNAITTAEKTEAAEQGDTSLGSYTLTGCTLMPATDATGLSTTGDIAQGAYFVREVSAPANVTTMSDPFIVTVPTPAVNPAVSGGTLDGEWVYDVNVYPKNGTAEGPRKNVVDQEDNGVLLGAPVSFEVTQQIPALSEGATYDKFTVTDTLDPRLDPTEAAPVTVADATDPTITFTLGADYTATWTGQTLEVVFTPAGLAKLVAGHNIVIGFDAVALEVGEIPNQAYVNINDLELTPGQPNTTEGSPTNVVQTRWGTIGIQKVNAVNEADGLAGAEFEVYMGTTEACVALTLAQVTALQQVTNLDGTDYIAASGADGAIVIDGLWVGDTELVVDADGTVTDVNEAGHDFDSRCYYLVEVQAPDGFILPAGDASVTAVVVPTGDNSVTVGLTIPNTQQSVPTLPFTGANGQLMLTLGGIGLAIVAVGGVLLVRRRRHIAEVNRSA